MLTLEKGLVVSFILFFVDWQSRDFCWIRTMRWRNELNKVIFCWPVVGSIVCSPEIK